MKGRQINYSVNELAWVEKNKELDRVTLHQKFILKFNRNDVSKDNLKSLCTRKGWKTGRTGCFSKGQTPHNKGKKMPYHPNSARTQFKKGQTPHNTKYLGHERITKEGYIEISVNETNPHTGYERRHVLKHRYLWEQKNGKLPKSTCLKCLDGNRQNTSPENWIAIPRSLLPLLVKSKGGFDYDNAPKELKPVILNLAKLKNKSREILQERKK